MNRFKQKFKKNVPQKLGSVTFMCLMNPNFMQKIKRQLNS